MSKLTFSIATEIREVYRRKDMTQVQLAAHFKTDQSTISKILRGIIWNGKKRAATRMPDGRHTARKLTDVQEKIVCTVMRVNSRLRGELAQAFSVDPKTISRIYERRAKS
jgi:DNA-binding MarR family transcriptional regulator